MSVDPKTIFEAVTKPVLELLSDRGLGLYIPRIKDLTVGIVGKLVG